MEKEEQKSVESSSSSDSQEMNQIPLNKSMIQADTETRNKKGGKKKAKGKRKNK
jgi:hypothetical protein